MEPGVHVTFEQYPILMGAASKAAGREIFEDRPYVRIKVAGMDKDEFFGPVNEQIRARFPQEWEAFKKGMEVPTSGTPVERWPQLTPSQVKVLKQNAFRTVEDVASASDQAVESIGMGGRALRHDAQRFLSLASSAADGRRVDDLEAKLAAAVESGKDKDAKLIAQADQLRTLQGQMDMILAKLQQPEEEPKAKKK
jgi:hypothetical protein